MPADMTKGLTDHDVTRAVYQEAVQLVVSTGCVAIRALRLKKDGMNRVIQAYLMSEPSKIRLLTGILKVTFLKCSYKLRMGTW